MEETDYWCQRVLAKKNMTGDTKQWLTIIKERK